VSITGAQVTRFLNELFENRSAPRKIICDNGMEFNSKAMLFWSRESSVKLGFIQLGKPTQNAFVESLNRKFRSECLNRHWFRTKEDASRSQPMAVPVQQCEAPQLSELFAPVAFAKNSA
jgi:putative transposase